MFRSPEDFANAAFSSLEMQRDDFETQMCVMKCGEIFGSSSHPLPIIKPQIVFTARRPIRARIASQPPELKAALPVLRRQGSCAVCKNDDLFKRASARKTVSTQTGRSDAKFARKLRSHVMTS